MTNFHNKFSNRAIINLPGKKKNFLDPGTSVQTQEIGVFSCDLFSFSISYFLAQSMGKKSSLLEETEAGN